MNYYKTGQFAKLANVSERTIRYYDKIGLLKPSFVMENGYRQYSDLDLLKLQKILSLKHLGFSIEEIFPMVMDNTNLKESFELQIDLIEDKISHLQSLKDALKRASQTPDLSWNMILSLVQLSNEETNIIEQYKNAKNLNDRISLHEKYSTNIVKSKYVNDSKITDHYAIIPTGQGYENYNGLNQLQKDIYKLIVKRFLCIFYPAAEFSKLSITISVENEEFSANSKVCTKLGYLEIAKPKQNGGKSVDNEVNEEMLKKLKKGQEIGVINFETKDAETSPPSRYNSGSIILAMENAGKLIEDEELREQIKGAGIGTSATRAEIMKKLERIKYIQINTKTQIITPTEKGEVIFDVVNSSMPDMLNPKLTASWEKGLEMVANKEIGSKEFMDKLENYIKLKFKKLVI